jgi:RNA polymerase sigma-70 factor, ECF subfamily
VNFPDRMDNNQPEPESSVEQVIESLHAEFSATLLRLGWSILRDWGLAADAVQETFRIFAEKRETIPSQQHRGWLFKTVQFQALNIRRARLRREIQAGRLREDTSGYVVDSPSQRSELSEQVDAVKAAIELLPEDQRRIVKLRLGDEKGFAEIAKELNLPLGTVLSRMRLAIAKIRSRLQADDELR